MHGLHSVWCSLQGWDIGTLGNTLSGCVTQDLRVGPSEDCAIHPTHPVCLVACTSKDYCCAYRLVHKWINEGLRSLWANPISITSKWMGCINVGWKIVGSFWCNDQGWWCWVCVWRLSYAKIIKKFRVFSSNGGVFSVCDFVTQFCSHSNVSVWSVDTCVFTKLTFPLYHARHSCSIFTALWCGCPFVKLAFYLPHTLSWFG